MVRRATEPRAEPMEKMIGQRVAGTGAIQKKPAVRETRADKLRRERIRAKAEGKTTMEAKSGRAFARARTSSHSQPQPPPPPLHPATANFKRGAIIAKPVKRPMPKLPLRATNEAEESWEENEAANVEEETFVQSAAHKERILKKGLAGPLTGRASTMGGGSRRLSVFGKRTISTTASAKKPSASITFIGRASEASRAIFANAGRPFSRPSLAPQTIKEKEKKAEEAMAGPSASEPGLPSPPPPPAAKVPTPPNSPHAFFSTMSRSELAKWRNALDEIWEEKKSPVRVRRTPGKQKGVTFARLDASEEIEQRHSPAKIPAAASSLRSCFTPGRQPLNPRLSVVEDVEEDDATPTPPSEPQAPPPSISIPIIISPASDSVLTASTAETTANESQILFTLNPDNSTSFHTLLAESTLGTDVTLADTTLTTTVAAMHLSAATNSTAASVTPKVNSSKTGTPKRGTPGAKSPKSSGRSNRSRAGKKSLDGTALAYSTVDMSSQGQGLVESGQPLAESTLLAPGSQRRPAEPPMDLSPINPPPPRRSSRHIRTPDRYGHD